MREKEIAGRRANYGIPPMQSTASSLIGLEIRIMPSTKGLAGCLLLLLGCLILTGGYVSAQEVVITDFPIGVGGSVDPALFKPYQSRLQTVADALRENPKALAIITGSADAEQYRENNDAKNPGLALGRAHALRLWMMQNFSLDTTRLLVQSQDAKQSGPQFRFASIRIVIPPKEVIIKTEPAPVIQPQAVTPVAEPVKFVEHFGLQLGGGVSSSPFGGIPIVSGAITWKQKIYVEGVVGHTLWNGEFKFDGVNLDTKRRLAGCNLIVYPFERTRVGFLLGWTRIEDISRDYYEYVRLSEGALIGVRGEPLKWLSISGAWYPSTERTAGIEKADAKDGLFLFSITAHKLFGGAR
jgi:hypothetical protein